MRLPLGRADEAQPTRCLAEHAESDLRQPAHVREQGEYQALPTTAAGGANKLELKMVVARRHGKMLGRSVLGRPWAAMGGRVIGLTEDPVRQISGVDRCR